MRLNLTNKVFLAVLLLMLSACSTPAQRFAEHAVKLSFKEESVASKNFQHQLFRNQINESAVLHVYLDGDGTPWERGRWAAADPTSRRPLILELMAIDKVSSVLLGRPCYHRIEFESSCDNTLWTSQRYSAVVVNSMVQALNRWLVGKPFKRIVLIGYSGGGTLAMLMAPQIKQLEQVVTLAANLDVTAWNKYHGFPPFNGSLNPTDYLPKYQKISQLHLAGEEDSVVPAAIIEHFAEQVNSARFKVYPRLDHSCCWQNIWPDVLAEMEGG